jgi:hypothetical protein
MIYLPPIACTLFGTALLHLSWRRATPDRAVTTAIGWLFLVGSLALWVGAAGAEYAPVFAILALPFAAWLLASVSHERRERPSTTLTRRSLHGPELAKLLNHLGLFAAVVPLAGTTSSLVATALIRWWPGEAVNSMAIGVLLMPVLWGLLAFWVCATERRLRAVSLLAGLGVLGGVLAAT